MRVVGCPKCRKDDFSQTGFQMMDELVRCEVCKIVYDVKDFFYEEAKNRKKRKMAKNKYKNLIIIATTGEICDAIENEMIKKKRNISNKEVQEVIFRLVKEKKAKVIGTTDKDGDLLTGNLREEGLKILNLNELNRRKQR